MCSVLYKTMSNPKKHDLKQFLDLKRFLDRTESLGQEALETRETLHSIHYREMTKEEQEAFQKDWLNHRIQPLERIQLPGEFFYL